MVNGHFLQTVEAQCMLFFKDKKLHNLNPFNYLMKYSIPFCISISVKSISTKGVNIENTRLVLDVKFTRTLVESRV